MSKIIELLHPNFTSTTYDHPYTSSFTSLIELFQNQTISRPNDGLLSLPFQQPVMSLQTSNGSPYNQNRWNSNYGHSAVNPNWSSASEEENWAGWNRVFKLVILCFVSTFGSMGSIFLISAITVIETLQMRSNTYLASLAFGHLLVTLIVLPASAIAILAEVTADKTLCHVQWLLTITCLVVTMLSFASLAIDNYFALNQMIRYKQCCTKLRVLFQLLFIWTAAGVLSWVQHHYQWGPEFCSDKRGWEISLNFHPYLLGSFVLITLLTMVFFTRTLFLHKHYKLHIKHSTDMSFIFTDGYLLHSNAFVYFVTLCMWMPMIVLMVLLPIKSIPQHYLDTAWSLAMANSVSCPYLYAASQRDLLDAFHKLFFYCCFKSHVSFTRRGAPVRRTQASESHGLRVHIIPGLNIYAQRKDNENAQNVGAGATHVAHSSTHVFF